MASAQGETAFSLVDARPVGALHCIVLGLCAMCMVIDGFDVQAMAYAAPALIREWGATRAMLGPVFGSGLLGMFVGSLSLGALADVVGRRPILIAATAWVALCMALTPSVSSIGQLIGLRFAAGIGMGAVVPNAMALAGEYSPARIRVTLMMAVSSGYIVGGVVGGAVAALVIAPFGWGGVFYAGAILTGLLSFSMLLVLPESLQFCLMRQRDRPRTAKLIRSLELDLAVENALSHASADAPRPRTAARTVLFGERRIDMTLLLWAANFANMLCAYFLAAWIPVLMSGAGYSSSGAALAGTALWTGGLVGNFALGVLIDRLGFAKVLLGNFLIGGLAIAGISVFHAEPVMAVLFIALAGFGVLGGQSGLNALAVTIYPTSARATGAGWALGIGRLGAVLGPVVGGHLMALSWTVEATLLASAVPTIVTACTVGTLGLIWERRARVRPLPEQGAAGTIDCSVAAE